jgi:peroxiredoxin
LSSDTRALAARPVEESGRSATRQERRVLRLLVVVPLVFLLGLAGYAYLRRATTPATPPTPLLRAGELAPAFTYPDLEGRPVSLKDYRGKVVFLNVWATWCPPCLWEMPSMEALHRKYRDRDLVVLAVSIDALGKEAVLPYMKKLGLTFSALLDPKGTVKRLYQTTGVPETFLIGRQGRLIRKIIGPRDWTSRKMTELIEIALRSS